MASKLALIFLAVFAAVAMVSAKPGQNSEAYKQFMVSSISLGAPDENIKGKKLIFVSCAPTSLYTRSSRLCVN